MYILPHGKSCLTVVMHSMYVQVVFSKQPYEFTARTSGHPLETVP